MKIKNISCTQFAGVRDRNIPFEGGMNVIYGKNESGKSTLVNLLSRTLFQNARIDGRTDREFKELYFPSTRRGSVVSGDFADGKIIFETEDGTYTLSKEWGGESRCFLSTPDGVIRDQKIINNILKEKLLYGEGVYSDLLFSSQRNTDISLQTLLDASKKTDAKQEITNAVSQAFSESDGISLDAIEQAIQKRIEKIAGKHWDAEKGMPVRKTGRWSVGLGEILEAYYKWEDAKNILNMITALEKNADEAAADYTVKDHAAHSAEAAYERFRTYAGQLTVQKERRDAIERLEKDLAKLKSVLNVWPQLDINLEKARTLAEEKKNRELLDQYENACALMDELKKLREKIAGRFCPEDQEISEVKKAQNQMMKLENKLSGMNLQAFVKMFGANEVRIVGLRTGQVLNVEDDLLSITEAVKIMIPGVMEMELSPADVNVSEVQTAIEEQKKKIDEIFEKYAVDSLEALEKLKREISDAEGKAENCSERLSRVLGEMTYETLETAAKAVDGNVRNIENICQDIMALCGSDDIGHYIAAKEAMVTSYSNDYGSVKELKAAADLTETKLEEKRKASNEAQEVPVEYANIANPEKHLENLQEEMRQWQKLREEALNHKVAEIGRLENYKENLSSDPVSDAESAERRFADKKALLEHWMHIYEVFQQQKQNIQNNPMQDIADHFARYLSMISEGRISSEFPEPEKLNMSIYSDRTLLDYGKLSEGTKETVSLAFRLAVLDHLFPEGGGVIVFDDPFTDMDAERTAKSCELITECATRHQVIFLTCKEEYCELLAHGNHIKISV